MTAFYILSALAAVALGAMVVGAARIGPAGRATRAAAAVAVAAVTSAVFFAGGAAQPAAPLAARIDALAGQADADLPPDALAARRRLEAKRAPEDPAAWRALGFAEARLGRWTDAIAAFERALRLGPTTQVLTDLADALIARDEGAVGPRARALAAGALLQDPQNVRARRVLAIGQLQDGDAPGAVAAWSDLIESLDADDGRARLLAAEAAGLLSRPQAGPVDGGGDGAAPFLEAGGDLDAMARGMVERLDARLAEDPDDFAGWLVLARTRAQLGEWAQSAAALEGAEAAAGRPGEEAILDAAANGLLALAQARRADISPNPLIEEAQ